MSTPTPAASAALAAAASARTAVAAANDIDRAVWLEALADALNADAKELVAIAMRETHLPEARLRGELVRTVFQARFFALRLREGGLFEARVDAADPEWPMGPRPDIRRSSRPMGVVLVFSASNFPFAFSVAGGDTVSALAAGCPVVVKAHEGHPELSKRVAALAIAALEGAGAPVGVLGMITSREDGIAAVQDTRVAAVGFTGSVAGGRALFDLAVGREDPIPFYGELGSTNPVFVTQTAWASRADEIVAGFTGSFTLGTGQFCTKPGILFTPDSAGVVARLAAPALGPMLGERIRDGFAASVSELAAHPSVSVLWTGEAGPDGAVPTLLGCGIDAVLADPSILEQECFGPAALLVQYADERQLFDAAAALRGTLTASVQAGSASDATAIRLVAALADRAGRVLWNDWPTGVTVSDAQHHGGPWPATTAPRSSSVGSSAAARFRRPVAYQNMPSAALPPELR